MKKAFALLYALMYVFLVMITVTAVTALAMSDIRQSKKSEATAGAYQAAVSGMDDALTRWELGALIANNTGSEKCDTFTGQLVNKDDPNTAKYDMKLCSTNSSRINPKGTINVTGYYKGSQITLYNAIDHTGNGKKGPYIYQIGQ